MKTQTKKKCSTCRYYKTETYHDKMYCRDCRQKDRYEENITTN